MGCVNRNGKEFKALAARNNVASNTLELLTHKYWLETGNETLFPSDVYIQAQLGNGHYLEKGKNVRALWKMQYNSPKEFASMGALQSAYKEASKYFPETAIVYYKNAKGNFMLSVKRPVEKADYTKDEFFDEFDNMGSMKDVKKFDLGIKEKQVYGIDKVQELYNKFNTDKTSQALADRAFNIAKELGLQITFDESLPFGIFGRYTNNNTLRFKKSFLEGDMMNSEKAPIMLHEVLHALSMYALSDQTKNWKRSENLEGFRTEMNSLYQNLKSNPLLKGERGILNLPEFVAELANPVFRSKIQQIDKEAKAKKSFWSRVLDAFKKLLGLHVTNTYYQRSMNALEKALDAFDIDTYMRYNGIKKSLRDGYNAKEWEFNSMSDAEVKSNVSNYFDKKVYNAELQSLKEKAIANGTFMKAPNGKDTKLTERQWLQVRTKAFKDWFGDWENNPKEASKIVDENGEPLVVYHGGEANIEVFLNAKDNPNYKKTKHANYHNNNRVGIYFSKYRSVANNYARKYGKSKEVYSVFLNIRKPYNVKYSTTFLNRLTKVATLGIVSKPDVANIKAEEVNTAYEGHDGINHQNGEELIIWDSNKVKSATDNTGEFSTTNPEIQNYELTKEVTDSMSGEQLKDELSLIKQESADYGIVNGIEEEHKHSGKAVPTVFMFADGTRVQAPFRPNAQQVDALNAMDRFMKSNETSMTLSGYAGTGKTSLMELIAKKGQMQYRPVVFCASTNKAAVVLKNRVSKAGFDASTLNKIFGIQVEVDPNSKSYNAKNLVNKVKDPSEIDIIPGTTVIIDEASMINEENYNILNRIAEQKGLKIIYVGDEAQLAPVNENKISKVFRNGEGKVIRLTQVERTDDNAILKEATDIRNGKPLSRESSFNSKGEGVAYISPEHQDAIDEVIEHYVKGLKQDPNYFRILAFTNKAVAAYNNQVRELLGYNTPVPQRGEPMTGYNNWGYDWRTKTYRFINSEAYKVIKADAPITVSTRLENGTRVSMQAIPVTLEDSLGKIDTFNYMDIKSNPENRQAAMILANEKKRLYAKAKQVVGRQAKAEIYAQINDLDKFLFVNDNIEDSRGNTLQAKTIDFGYAMTVHKSQGSTFTHVLMDDVDIARGSKGNDMSNAWSVDLGEESTNDPSTAQLKSTSDVDLGDLGNTEEESTTNNTVNKRQQLEYVGVSRATDTVTVISNGIKKEGSPLHPEKAIKEDKSAPQQANQNTIPKQLISHLKSQGINVKDRAAMEEFLKTHKLEYLQQATAYGKEHPYENASHVGKIPEILSIVKAKKYNKPGTDAVTLDSEGHRRIYLIDHSADKELADNLKDGDGFGIRKVYNVNTITKDDVREIIRNIASDYRGSEVSIRHRLQNLGLGPKDLSSINIAAELKMVSSSNGDMVLSRREEWTSVNNNRRSSNGRESKEGSRLEDRARHDGIDLYMTPQGEVYGFVDKEGNIYLDETKISPEHPIHEYTHLWDRTVQQKNPKLWQRGVELMKQTPLWNEILNDANYGKVWQSMNLPQEKLDNLIASEVHARFTGEGGEKLLNQIAEKQGQSGIIAKLKQWILDVWKDLKATFGNWSQEDLDKLTLKDFNHMTVRDFTEGINLKDASNATYTSQQKQQVDWARTSSNGYEVSTRGDRRFSALVATFKPGTIIDGVDVGGKTIEHVYQNVIKKSSKGKAPAKNSKLYNESLKTNEEREDFSYQKGYLPLWKEWAKQNPELMVELKKKSQGKVLTDQFANTRVSQARALAEILNESEVKDSTQDTTVENPSIAEGKTMTVKLPNYEYFNDLYEDTSVDAEWKIPYLKELDAQLSLETPREESINIINQMDKILQSTSEEEYKQELNNTQEEKVKKTLDDYDKINQQLNNLLDNEEGLTATDLRHVAQQIADELSDLITQVQSEKGLAAIQYPSVKTNIDFMTASRKEIVKAIGIDNMLLRAQKIFEVTDRDDSDVMAQAFLICDNWDALVSMASDAFAFNEGFGIRRDYSEGHYKVTDDSTVDYDNFSDYSNDADVNAEEGGKDEQEHWQIENRTIDVLNSMSALVRQGIHECYVLDADGNKVISKWGIAERVNPRNATNSILRWTQGSLSMDDMINKLSEKQKYNPWLSQLVERLSDKTGKETDFQSQFYGVFQKHFQPYSIVLLEDGKYHSIPVNSHPALTEAMNSISAQFKIGEHSLFAKTRINARDLGSKNTTGEKAASNLYKSLYEMQEVKKALKTGGELTSELADKFTRNVLAVCHILNYNITEDMISDITNEENVDSMTTALSFMVQNLTKAKEALASNKIKEYDPFKYYGDYNIRGELSKFLAPVTEKLEDVAISAFYDSGKMYQSYVTPSFMTKLMSKFKQPRKDFEKFMMEEYGSSEWFKDKKEWRYKDGWRIEWLQKLATDDTMRQMFDHKVELNFNKHNYMRTMSDSEYALSLITEYYSDNADLNADMAPSWYRVPMQSNKPSSEFIRFYSYRGNKETYKENIVDGLQQMVNQELSRIQTVRMRNLLKSDNGFIKNFDTNGRKFCFFPVLNSYLENTETAKAKRKWLPTEAENNRLAELLQMKVDGKEIDEGELKQLLHGAIRNSVEARVQDILEKWEKAGILEAAKSIKGIYPKDYDKFKNKEERDSYINPYVRDQVENFLWNDTFASKNILQLTLTDIAFYKDAEDLQKRLAQLHAPGIRGRIDATDYNGKRVSDGRYRTLVLKDFDNFKSNIIANITEVFDRKIRNAKSDAQKKQLEALKDSLVRKPGTLGEKDKGGKYWNINVADAQGFSSPSSYRKKALIFGKWSKHAEKIYQKLQNNDYNYTDLETAFQPLKPFVYSKLEKNLGVEGAPITTMHVPFQAKNAEYLLIMADALLKGEETSRPNLLRAIYRVMEDSEKLCPTKGIDTVQFESAIKSSLQGAMDIAQYREMEGGEEAAYTFMKNQIFKEEYNQKGERVYQNYNTDTFVHETSYEDYCLQQEVPEHFKEHSQAHGSQIRMITPSDLDFFTTDENGNQVDNYYEWTEPDPNNPGKTIQRKVKADEFRREYEQTIADNVKESIETLAKELCLTGEKRSRKEQNIALAKILQREILSSPRYGIDLIQACSIDKETGEFRIPKGDPIQAKRIEQLINSIIKNRINKQKIAGGPIVQVSNFGTSKQLHIRFKDKKTNGLLPLEEEYNPSEHNGISYKDYCAKYQGGIAHFEVYMPIWSDDLFKKFGKPDGTIDVEAIEALDPELLKMVSYRIPTEDKYSCAPMKVVGFMPREAGDAIMLPYELTEIDDSDFDVDKRYVMRKDIPIKEKNSSDYMDELTAKAKELYKKYNKYEAEEKYMDRLISDIIDHPNRISVDTEFRKELMKEYRRLAFSTEAPTSGKTYRDNKIVDMTYAVLSNEMTADKILNPGGFDAPKKMGYMVAAYKNNSNVTWKELEGKSIDALKDLCYTDKDLTYADTQVQFYKQNAAAASLIGVFAVNKVAHATLESNNIWLDVSEICGENPFYIAVDSYDRKEDPKTGESALVVNGGTTLGGRIQIDKKYDSEGNLIGKTLGSLVSASADAVKDPILNLMNINMTTAGMLNTMLRLGMPFNDAALFLSQDIIGRILNQFNKENLNNYKSLDEIIEGWLKAYRDKNGISEDSNINTEPLTKDELVEGITDKEHEATDYKVLLAFQKLRSLTDAMRNPTYITRFNSISSAVGPLIIDNLIMEHKLNTFNKNVPKSGTHFYNAETEGAMINMYDIFAEHPLLEQFHRTVGMAKTLFHDMPTGSTGFRNLMDKLDAEHSDIADKLYRDKKLFDQFANFYQSYLLIASGVINPNSLSNYVNGFAKWFMDQKYAEKYPENELIKAIKMNVTKASNRPFLTINTTGADEQVKEVLRSGWIDLHKADPVLSQRLFEYSFFRAGIGFSPKTFMSLVPTYVKERIKSKDGKSSYVDTYRNFPDVSMHFDRIIEQFVRNNWDNNKLAPYRGDKDTEYTIDVPHGRLTVWREEDKASVRGLSYIKTKGKGGTTNLWKKVSKESDSDIVFNLVKPLGNNGEYLEMNLNDITAPLSDTTKTAEDNVASAFEENGAVQDSTEETPTSPVTDTEAVKQVSELAKLMMKLNPDWTVETANRNIEKIKSDDKQLWKSRKFLQNVFKQKGLELSEQVAMDEFKKMC